MKKYVDHDEKYVMRHVIKNSELHGRLCRLIMENLAILCVDHVDEKIETILLVEIHLL